MAIELRGKELLDKSTGELYSLDVTPKFLGLKYDDYRAVFKQNKRIRWTEPMKAQELEGEDLEAMISDPNTVAEKKWDGHRAFNYLCEEANRLFMTGISKESGWFSEFSDNVPHLRDLRVPKSFMGSCLDGEMTLPVVNCTCRDVQGITGSLPDVALQTQLKRGLGVHNCFDIPYYKGVSIQGLPYWKRKVYLLRAVKSLHSEHVQFCTIFATQEMYDKLEDLWVTYCPDSEAKELCSHVEIVESYDKLFKRMIAEGDEGIILKDITARYEQKKTKTFVKMKGHNTYDCIIMGYEEPTSTVDLNDKKTKAEDWLYWHDPQTDCFHEGVMPQKVRMHCVPVTKFYAKGWIGAIIFGVWKDWTLKDLQKAGYDVNSLNKMVRENTLQRVGARGSEQYRMLVEVGRASGMDEAVRKELSEHKDKYLGTVVEVLAQKIINKETGSLQHPRFKDFRPDKRASECTFNDHIRRYGEDKK